MRVILNLIVSVDAVRGVSRSGKKELSTPISQGAEFNTESKRDFPLLYLIWLLHELPTERVPVHHQLPNITVLTKTTNNIADRFSKNSRSPRYFRHGRVVNQNVTIIFREKLPLPGCDNVLLRIQGQAHHGESAVRAFFVESVEHWNLGLLHKKRQIAALRIRDAYHRK